MNRYAYNPFAPALTPAARFLMFFTAGAFLVQLFFDRLTGGGFIKTFSLSWPDLLSGKFWQLATYMFLHGGIWHIVLNMLGLFFFGPEIERTIGTRRFYGLYFACGIIAGLGWILIDSSHVARCVGASGAIFGILGAFAGLFPHRPVTLLVFFVVPVTMRARTLAIALGLISLIMILSQPGQIAYSAHLAGGLAGYLYGLYWAGGGFAAASLSPKKWWNDLLWHWRRRKFKVLRKPERDFWEDDGPPPDPREVDEVLSKISRWGMSSLDARDREILNRASWRGKI